MAYDEALAERVRAHLPGASERRMFGALAFLLDGSLLVSVRGESLLVRVGTDGVSEALTRGARPAQMGARTMKGWVEVAPGSDLADWVALARAAAARQP
jgi:hypothetical protein